MKLQFAFPNPHKKGRKKGVAKRSKKRKTKSVKAKLKEAVKMAKKRKVKRPKHRGHKKHKRSRKNPLNAYAAKGGKRIGHTQTLTKAEMNKALKSDSTLKSLKKKIKAAHGPERAKLSQHFIHHKKTLLAKMKADRSAFSKDVKAYKADGATITFSKTKEKAVAKRKKKKASKKKVTHKRKASGKRKHAKRKHTKKKHTKKKHAKKHVKRKHVKRKSKRKGGKRRRRLTKAHRHTSATGHFHHGSKAKVKSRKRKGSYKISAKFGKGKRRVKMSGRVRVSKKGLLSGIFKLNPFRSNPVNFKSRSGAEKILGHDPVELGTMAAAAFGAPYLTKMILPYIAAYVPAALVPYISGIIPVAFGAGLNAVNDAKMKNGSVQIFADALIAVGVISAVYSTGSKAAGLSGINYTPHMGIMPQMNGINFTPNMGIMPQLNGVSNSGDFGAPGDYGGNAGYRQSRADFGADWSQDSEYDTDSVDGDMHSSAMN